MDIFVDASSIMRRADSLIKNGKHLDAIRYYHNALLVLTLSTNLRKVFSRRQRKAVRFFTLRARIQMSFLYSKLGHYRMARRTALEAWQFLPTGSGLKEERAEVIRQLTTALVDEISMTIIKRFAEFPAGNTSGAHGLPSASAVVRWAKRLPDTRDGQ
jgi:hypothetical protein